MARQKETFVRLPQYAEEFPFFSIADAEPEDTIRVERNRLARVATEPLGAICRCCAARAKIYTRPFGVGQAMALYRLVARYSVDARPYTYKEIQYNGRDYTFLTGFNLIVHELGDNRLGLKYTKKGGTGRFSPTPRGIQFVAGTVTIPASIIEFRGTIIAASQRQVSFLDIVRKRPKDYDDLMTRTLLPG